MNQKRGSRHSKKQNRDSSGSLTIFRCENVAAAATPVKIARMGTNPYMMMPILLDIPPSRELHGVGRSALILEKIS